MKNDAERLSHEQQDNRVYQHKRRILLPRELWATRVLCALGGIESAEHTILEHGWRPDQMVGLVEHVGAVVTHHRLAERPLSAAPWYDLLHNVLRHLPDSELRVAEIASVAWDYLSHAARKRSALNACHDWRDHFQILVFQSALSPRVASSPDKNLTTLEDLVKHGTSPRTRFEAQRELAGHHVVLDSNEMKKHLDALDHLDARFIDDTCDWVTYAARWRPKIEWATRKGGPGPFAAEREIKEYAKLVLPRGNMRQIALGLHWLKQIDLTPKVDVPEQRYRPYISAIEPYRDRDILNAWGSIELGTFSIKSVLTSR